MYNLRAGSLFKPPCVTTAMAKDYHVSGAGSKSFPSRARGRGYPLSTGIIHGYPGMYESSGV